jgi:dolichyl-phosphate beta-glucosyltransferase
MQTSVGIVIPVFNEQSRLDTTYFAKLSKLASVKFVFVDDGSTDNTEAIIREFTKGNKNFTSIHLSKNLGKANAIRAGWMHLNEMAEFSILGFLDADGAFEFKDIEKLLLLCSSELRNHIFDSPREPEVCMHAYWSSRINLGGRTINRSRYRYLLGRILANIIKLFVWELPWDTQSGFKLFRNDDRFRTCLELPFSCKWLFDIELLLRLRHSTEEEYLIWEEPVSTWHDVRGSKVTWKQYLTIACDVFRLIGSNLLRKVHNVKR